VTDIPIYTGRISQQGWTVAEIVKNAAARQYEMRVGEHVALVQFRSETDGTVRLLHTEVPAALEGQGIGSRLARGVLDSIRAEGQQVAPQCTFIAGYIERHPEYQDLVAGSASST
jgi:predicted GNAT family acetyltransferase